MSRELLGRVLGVLIVLGAVGASLAVVREIRRNPQTDDAEVFANLIGIAPEVSGRIIRINVKDNQFVRQGELLFEIDPVPYEYALETARSQQAVLEGQVKDLRRTISAQDSAVVSARANTRSSAARIGSTDAAVEAARAGVDAAKAEVARAEADYAYAENNVLRLEPLLNKQFVTVDLVDQARTARSVKGEAVRQARARLAVAEAQSASAIARQKEAQAGYEQSTAQLDQSMKSITILDPLVAQREAREAAVKNASYDLQRSKVYAPFNARVTNLTISEGAYAHAGQQAFTLIDARTWWVIANFRETELKNIQAGMKADVYVMSRPNQKFEGTIDSVGFGVTPDASLVGSLSQGLPDVQRSLNWVHLATRFPVRIRVNSPSPGDFRIGASATAVIHGNQTGASR
ncbi:MAG: HlyD family efflux transporter periplasmic adaptor subunit [Bryobacteraceae bacterium]|jgi:multidrug efflux system membrane fusion protein